MDLQMDAALGALYRSGTQITRSISESWGEANLYCAACDSAQLSRTPANTRAIDYACHSCSAVYQLKSSRVWNERRVPDAAYESMIAAIRSDRIPNLLVMQYSNLWTVRNLMLVPSFFFSESAVEKRPPLALTARRAGWVGCNILLSNIAPEGKLRIVNDGIVRSPVAVREEYDRIRPLAQVATAVRGWLLDVLNIIHSIGRDRFTLSDVYAFDSELAARHPDNRNIRPKIRQKLQVLRDLGLVEFLGAGEYRLCR